MGQIFYMEVTKVKSFMYLFIKIKVGFLFVCLFL